MQKDQLILEIKSLLESAEYEESNLFQSDYSEGYFAGKVAALKEVLVLLSYLE